MTVGSAADIRLDADGPDAPWVEGRVAEIARVASESQSFTVKIDVPAGPEWRSGLFGRARFPGPSRQAVTAPAPAVLTRGQLRLVFVVSPDNIARLRAIRTGDTFGDRVEVLAGLSAGETVVVSPPLALADGNRVTVSAREGTDVPQTGAGR